jgi:hypothetical protein
LTDAVSNIEQMFDSKNSIDMDGFGKAAGISESKRAIEPFPLVAARDLTASPVKIDWLLENVIERRSLNLLFGEPGAGKSLFALDWAFCMAAGIDWHGHKTKPTDIVIIAGEGFSGFGRRLKALEQKYGMKTPEGLFISERPAQLLDERSAQSVAESIHEICSNPGFVIIDTLHRNMNGDENSSQDIGKFINNIDNILKPLGCAVLIVHHSGHENKQRSRGSSSIRAAMDGEFSAIKDKDGITLSCHKAKDFEAFKPLTFALVITELDWPAENNAPMTSVYLSHMGEAKPSSPKRRLSARDDAVLTCLNEAIAKHGIEPSAEIKSKYGGFNTMTGKSKQIVHIDHWRDTAYKTITVECETPEKKAEALKKAFKRSRDKLFDCGFTVEHGDYAWPILNQSQGQTGTKRDTCPPAAWIKGDRQGHTSIRSVPCPPEAVMEKSTTMIVS